MEEAVSNMSRRRGPDAEQNSKRTTDKNAANVEAKSGAGSQSSIPRFAAEYAPAN